MGIYIESLILYFVLFFSGTINSITAIQEAVEFSIAAELAKTFLYTIPSLVLIWYLVIKSKSIWVWIILKPGKKDLVSCIITFPCLLITGFIISFISSYIGGNTEQIQFQPPNSYLKWAILSFSCFSSAYLEESFFRFYLLTKKEDLNLNATSAVVISVILFSICHIYEGPWGFLNSVISAVILAFLFLRYRSLHGVAVAHGLYNITVYIINAQLMQS